MKRLLALALVLAAAGAATVAIPALAATRTVKVGDSSFRPTKLTVRAGTKVRRCAQTRAASHGESVMKCWRA